MGGLSSKALIRLTLDGNRVTDEERINLLRNPALPAVSASRVLPLPIGTNDGDRGP